MSHPSATRSARPRSRPQGGFSLIEVLISLVILAVGMLGTAGLMLATLRSNQSASFGSTAARLATEYQELLSLNTDVVTDTANGASVFTIDTTGGTLPTAPSPANKCVVGTCTPAELHAFMVYDWARRVQDQLPNGVVRVCRDGNPKDANGIYRWACTAPTGGTGLLTVKFGWSARNDAGEGTFTQTGSDANPPRFVVTLYGSQQDAAAGGCAAGATAC